MKKIYLCVSMILLLVTACEKQVPLDVPGSGKSSEKTGNPDNIEICHLGDDGTSHVIKVNLNAWPAHRAHGDIRVDDEDNDGYVLDNPCGYGQMGDCDDLNAAINPGTAEVCGNGIDDNCNGKIDEDCIPSVTICNQTWMLNNLDVTHYRNGDPIPQVQDPVAWKALTTGAWCYYNNDPANASYGKLYNWYAVSDPRGLAPEGWHIPTYAEWNTLADCLGGILVAGGKMKTTGTVEWGNSLWYGPNTDATNSSGFYGLPGGIRMSYFFSLGIVGGFWSISEPQPSAAWARLLVNYDASLVRLAYVKYTGMSVRCIKD